MNIFTSPINFNENWRLFYSFEHSFIFIKDYTSILKYISFQCTKYDHPTNIELSGALLTCPQRINVRYVYICMDSAGAAVIVAK